MNVFNTGGYQSGILISYLLINKHKSDLRSHQKAIIKSYETLGHLTNLTKPYNTLNTIKQAQLGVPHSRIQVVLSAGAC